MLKKFLALCLASALMVSVFSGCGAKKDAVKPDSNASSADPNMVGNMYKTGLPIVKDKVTLNFAAARPASFKNGLADMDVIQNFEKQTNVHIEWNEIADSAWNEKTKLMLASGDLPDAFWGWAIDEKVIYTYGQQGIITPLEGLIDKYSPNIKKFTTDRPEIKKLMTYTDGHIYGIPTIAETDYLKLGEIMFINKEWLNKVGMKIPTTTDELYNVLKAFKEKDPNGNGKADEIPFTFSEYSSPGVINNLSSISSMFGSFGVVDNDKHLNIQNGKFVYVPMQQGFLEGLRYFNKLYSEKLIDPESFAQNMTQMQAKAKAPEGVGFTTTNHLDTLIDKGDKAKTWTIDDYKAARYQSILPLKGPSGKQLWDDQQYFPGYNGTRFLITKNNKYPEISMRWIDNMCDNGTNSLTIRNGLQDQQWMYTDGTKWTTQVPNAPVLEKSVHPTNYSVWWWLKDLIAKRVNDPTTQIKVDDFAAYKPVMNKEPIPNLKFTDDEQAELSTIEIDLKKYVESTMTKFIIEGVTDAQWNDYLAKVKSYKVDKLLQIYQQAYDRFIKN